MYTPVEVVIKPLKSPVINLPKKISLVSKAKYIESHPTANRILDMVCVDFLPNVSLKYTPKMEPISIGKTASEAVNNLSQNLIFRKRIDHNKHFYFISKCF